MNKQEYIELRQTLDFTPRHSRLFANMVIDLVLIAAPACLLRAHGLEWSAAAVLSYAVSIVSLSALCFRAFSMMHEAVHGTISKNRRLNDWAGLIYGSICFLPFVQWRDIHLLHHVWSGNVEKDPVRRLTLIFRGKPILLTRVMEFFWPTWIPAAAVAQNYVFWSECILRFDRKKGRLTFLSVAMPVLLWGAVFLFSPLVITALVIIPSIVAYLALVEMVNFPHHTDLPQYEGETKFSLWDQGKTARSCFYPKLFERYVLLNFNYHIEHHMYPTLPWYQLGQLSGELRKRLPDYFFSEGNEWVIRNRKRPFKEVVLSQSSESQHKAA
jgi:fatty acid desaturase